MILFTQIILACWQIFSSIFWCMCACVRVQNWGPFELNYTPTLFKFLFWDRVSKLFRLGLNLGSFWHRSPHPASKIIFKTFFKMNVEFLFEFTVQVCLTDSLPPWLNSIRAPSILEVRGLDGYHMARFPVPPVTWLSFWAWQLLS